MMNEQIEGIKKNIISIGRLLWDKDLANGLNGNISVRVDDERILITGIKTCLGMLQEKDIVLADTDGNVLDEGEVSTEKLMHTEIFKNFLEAKVIIHSHTTFTNAYFLENDVFVPRNFESKLWFGEIKAVEQNTPSVTDASPVIEALKNNNVMVLKNHGVVAMGKDLFDCFLLIQGVEEGIKMDAISRLYRDVKENVQAQKHIKKPEEKKYKLFSKEQMDEIVNLVNSDTQMQELGKKTDMTMDLAVKIDETAQAYRFQFKKGKIMGITNDDNAEFLITAPEKVWRAVFNQEIDPFVATTQKRMNLKGDFGKISKWYAPCSRIFELWTKVPVE